MFLLRKMELDMGIPRHMKQIKSWTPSSRRWMAQFLRDGFRTTLTRSSHKTKRGTFNNLFPRGLFNLHSHVGHLMTTISNLGISCHGLLFIIADCSLWNPR